MTPAGPTSRSSRKPRRPRSAAAVRAEAAGATETPDAKSAPSPSAPDTSPPSGKSSEKNTPKKSPTTTAPAPKKSAPKRPAPTINISVAGDESARTAGQKSAQESARSARGASEEPAQESAAESAQDNVVEFPESDHRQRLRRRRMGLVIGIVSAVLLAALVAVLYFSPLLAVRSIQVTGNDLLPTERAQQLLEPLQERPLPQVGTSQVEDLLAGEPTVQDVNVHAEPPHRITVEVIEHAPVAVVTHGDQATLYSATGAELARLSAEDAEARGLPTIAAGTDVNDPEVFEVVTGVLGSLPEEILTQMTSASAETVDSVTLTLADGRTVLWGNAENGESKAVVLQALLTAEEDAEIPAQEFDVSIPDQPVTR